MAASRPPLPPSHPHSGSTLAPRGPNVSRRGGVEARSLDAISHLPTAAGKSCAGQLCSESCAFFKKSQSGAGLGRVPFPGMSFAGQKLSHGNQPRPPVPSSTPAPCRAPCSARCRPGRRGASSVRRESDIGSLLDTMGHGMLYLNLLRRGGGLGGIYYYRLRGTIWPNTTW